MQSLTLSLYGLLHKMQNWYNENTKSDYVILQKLQHKKTV